MNEASLTALLLTLQYASLATAIVFVPGMLIAYVLARFSFPGKVFVSALTSLPLVLPPTAVGYLLLQMLATDGILGRGILGIDLDILLTGKAVIVACAVMSAPLIIRTARIAFEGVNLLLGQRRARRQGQDVEALQQEVITLLELDALLERRIDTLSGGERQRVALGRALCSGPLLLLMDEPMAFLDLGMRRRLLPFLRTIRESFDIPMLLVSHDPIEVQALCDDLVVLGDGPLLTLPRVSEAAARSQMIAVRSQDITLSTTRPKGLSARNVLPGMVRRVAAAGKKHLVFCTVEQSAVELAVEITVTSLRELDLKPETPVFLIIKATTLELC